MATAAGDGKRMITLISSEKRVFEVEAAVLKQSGMIEDDVRYESKIPIPQVTGDVLAKILEYCKKHADIAAGKPSSDDGRPATKEEIAIWDANYINVEKDVLLDIVMASDQLKIKSLSDLGCQRIAEALVGKTTDQIREWFYIENDFPPEEEAEILKLIHEIA